MTTTSQPTERDAAGAYQILSRAEESPSVLAVLTDEELRALEGADAPAFADAPFLSAAAEEGGMDADAAAAIALRSLIARGLVVLDEDAQQPEGSLLGGGVPARRLGQLDLTLAGLLTLRGSPLGVLAAHRQVAEQLTSLVVYTFPEGAVLEELVTADGFHHFSVPTRPAAVQRLVRYLDADQVAGQSDGPEQITTAAQLEGDSPLAGTLRDTRALTVLSVATGQVAAQRTVMATADSVWTMEMPEDAADEVRVQELSTAGLAALVERLLPDPAAA